MFWLQQTKWWTRNILHSKTPLKGHNHYDIESMFFFLANHVLIKFCSPNSTILVPLLFHAFSGFALLFKLVFALPLSFALCKCEKTKGFFKFHSISRCFSFNVFFLFVIFFFEVVLWFVCKAKNNTINSNTHLFTKKY